MTEVIEQQAISPASAAGPRLRGVIAVLVSRFPMIHETYVLREIIELERQGQPILLVPLHRGGSRILHEEAKPWLRRALYTPAMSLKIASANLRQLVKQPRRYFAVLGRLIAATFIDPVVLLRSLALFPKSVHLAATLRASGIRHVHAEFATDPATSAWIMSAVSDISYSFSIHGPDVFVHRLLMRDKIAGAEFIRAVSTFTKAFLSGLYPVLSEGKIEVVHVGVNPEVYADAAAAAAGRGSHRPIIFSAARLTETKAFPVLIDACARLARTGLDFECWIAGEGPQQSEVEDAIRQHDVADRVKLLGPRPQHEIARLIGEADVFVLPSVIAYSGQMDGIPVALMEAMAAGKPVIASAVSAIPELVDDGRSGLLVDVTHPEQLANALRRLIDDPALREQMGHVGQEKVRREFDVQRTAGALLKLLDHHHAGRVPASRQIASLDWDQLNVCALGVRRVNERRDSFIADVTITDGIRNRDVVVKQHRAAPDSPRTPADMARFEYDTLTDLHRRLETVSAGDPESIWYTVPRPLLLDEKRGAVIMERSQGRSLETIVRQARNRGVAQTRLIIPVRRAATWLRLMQSVTRSDDDGRHVLTALVVIALRDLDLACAADRRIARSHRAITETLRRLEAELASRPLPLVGHHGDFWTGNVFLGERRVDVLDFEGFREGLQLEDVAYFLVHMELYFAYPMFGGAVPRLRRTFLDAYGEGKAVDEEMLRLLELAKALQLLARGGGAERGSLREFWRRRALHRVIRRGLA